MATFTNTKQITVCGPVFLLLVYVPKRKECVLQHTDMYKNVHSSSNHNSEKLKTTQMPINRRMDKYIVIYKIKSRQNSSRMRKVRIMVIEWDIQEIYGVLVHRYIHMLRIIKLYT